MSEGDRMARDVAPRASYRRAMLSRLTILAASLALSTVAHAQGLDGGVPEFCETDSFEPTESFPASGAQDVPVNARIQVRYPADYFALTGVDAVDAVQVFRVDEDPGAVSGTLELIEGARDFDAVFFFPDELLVPGARYEIEARGFDADLVAEFRVIDDLDRVRPELENSLAATAEPFAGCDASDPCCDTPDGYRVDVEFAPAFDDGAVGSIEYLLYQTRGPDL